MCFAIGPASAPPLPTIPPCHRKQQAMPTDGGRACCGAPVVRNCVPAGEITCHSASHWQSQVSDSGLTPNHGLNPVKLLCLLFFYVLTI